MDPAFIPSLITGGVAIVAGLGGAALTGYLNRKNTADTLAAGREARDYEWTRTKEREHEVWLRNNRQESYVAFFDEAEKITVRLRRGDTDEIPVSDLDTLASLRGRIRLIGSHRLRVQAREVYILLARTLIARNVYARVVRQSTEDKVSDGRREREAATRWKDKLAKATIATTDFVDIVREDLGTADAMDEKRSEAGQP